MSNKPDTGGLRSRVIFCLAAATASFLLATAKPADAYDSRYLVAVAAFPAPTGAKSICQTYSWACAASKGQDLGASKEFQLVKAVNRKVNAAVNEVTDQRQYNTVEKWALPTRLGGDCEDFALLKKRELVRMGVDPRKLMIATVLDRKRNSHAVLVFRSAQGDVILDNLTNSIRSWKDTRYVFLRMQNPSQPNKWVAVRNAV